MENFLPHRVYQNIYRSDHRSLGLVAMERKLCSLYPICCRVWNLWSWCRHHQQPCYMVKSAFDISSSGFFCELVHSGPILVACYRNSLLSVTTAVYLILFNFSSLWGNISMKAEVRFQGFRIRSVSSTWSWRSSSYPKTSHEHYHVD